MKRLVVGLLLGVAACTPSSLHLAELSPVRDSTVMTAADLFASADSATNAKAPADAAQIIIVQGDSAIAAMAIYELPDIFWADIYVYNGGSRPYTLNPSQLILMDVVRTVFRPLSPDEAANIYVAKMRGIPRYQPKYIYDVQSSSQGYLSAYGNYGYYNGRTQTTVTQREDPYNALGYSIGAAIARHRNAKLGNMAGTLYTIGFVEGSSVPAKAGARGGVYWLKRVGWSGPLILRFAQSGYEVRFTTAQP
jgi:hypothetical protein